ncbi:hypothetical protein D3C75_1191760 [compost metagenome]
MINHRAHQLIACFPGRQRAEQYNGPAAIGLLGQEVEARRPAFRDHADPGSPAGQRLKYRAP